MYPTDEKILLIHKEFAANKIVFDLVYTHCLIIKEIAMQIVEEKSLEVDHELVAKGSLLHDIGVYAVINDQGKNEKDNYIQHGVIGFELLQKKGIVLPLCNIAKRHTGVGITKRDIINQHLNLPFEDYCATSLEERVVMYADKFHSKVPRFNSYNAYCAQIATFGQDKLKKFQDFAAEFGIPQLEVLSRRYHQEIV